MPKLNLPNDWRWLTPKEREMILESEHSGGAPLNSVQAKMQRAEAQAQIDEMQAIELGELREVRVIVGTRADSEPIVNVAYNSFEIAVAGLAGGFTLTRGTSAWVDPTGALITEPVRIYDVAIAPRNQHTILALAITLGHSTGQHSVYFRDADGVVAIVEV